MPSTAEYRALRRANDNLEASARRELRAIMSALDPSGPDEVQAILIDVLPALARRYGDAAGAVAAEWSETVIGLRDVIIPDVVEDAAVAASARWAVGDLYAGGALGTAYTRAEGSVIRHALQVGRSTIAESSTRSRVGYARILGSNKSCAFCVMAAGRGVTYSAAGGTGSKLRKAHGGGEAKLFHDFCRCTVVPIRSGSDWPADYDHKALESMYEDAAKEADTAVLKGGTRGPNKGGEPDKELSILQVMRRNYGLT